MADGVTSLDGTDGSLPVPATTEGDEITCPHCGQTNPKQAAGTIVDCRHCDRSFAQPRPPAFRRNSGASLSGAAHPSAPTDVGLGLTGAIAVAGTLVFYGAVVTPLSGTYFADLFGERGWVPYLITWLSVWAGVLLVIKAQLLGAQRRALLLDLLPESIAARITPKNASEFRAHLLDLATRELPPPPLAGAILPGAARSFLVERIENALERFRMRGSARDVVDHLASQSQLDANAVDSSYTMIRVFIWAIPLLGFIGTVIGISAAVAGFSDSVAAAVDLDVMKQSIGSVTTGLGVAFDTTLLALIMSIVIMFPSSSLQKSEEDFLSLVETYCDGRLGRRLDDGGTGSAGSENGLEELKTQISRLANTIEALDTKIGRSD